MRRAGDVRMLARRGPTRANLGGVTRREFIVPEKEQQEPVADWSPKDLIRGCHKLEKAFRVSDGERFRLKDVDPGDTMGYKSGDKPRSKEALAAGVQVLADLQAKLYAQDQWGMVLIFQAMDAAGKDGAIKHVFSGVNPQGCQVHSFKAPSSEELDHDYLWRCLRVLPNRGNIGIFNRSYYEETLAVRVHPEYLAAQHLPPSCMKKDIWENRYKDIRSFERYLTHNGYVVRKFFLYVSKKEQKRRFLDRIDDPSKNWKFSSSDVKARGYWDDYMRVYEETIQATATKDAPWYVVPADHKWFTRIVVASAIIAALDDLGLRFPDVSEQKKRDLQAARRALQRE
jgi:PPK2 family polyphosphate:nucleotide phosphotransferase